MNPIYTPIYAQAYGTHRENVEVPFISTRAPLSTDLDYPIGKRWINTLQNNVYSLISFSYSNLVKTANWSSLNTAPLVISSATTQTLTGTNTRVNDSNTHGASLIYTARKAIAGSAGLNSVPFATIGNGFFIITTQGADDSVLYYILLN